MALECVREPAPSQPISGRVIYDREATLAAIDRDAMVRLADELLGAHRGTDRSPMWRCPDPEHAGQTGRTPPVSIFADRNGEQRWKCHSCGAGGTAVDLVMQTTGMSVREALGELSRRTGTAPLVPGHRRLARRSRRRQHTTAPQAISPFLRRAIPELDRYVDECADALWRREGQAVRRWLTDTRGLPEPILRANRIGVDLGPARQGRPSGVPGVRTAVVLPVLTPGGACFVQLRTLSSAPGFPKYLNPREAFAPNPRLAAFTPATAADEADRPELLITEGIFDALSATSAGYRSVAFLGATYPDRLAAVALARLRGPLVVAFDPDPAGQAGSKRLVELLAAQRREAGVLRLMSGDLSACAAKSGDWPVELAARVEHATYPLRELPPALVRGTA